jgi:hypothetical protein
MFAGFYGILFLVGATEKFSVIQYFGMVLAIIGLLMVKLH